MIRSAVAFIFLFVSFTVFADTEKISQLGKYQGYNPAEYNGFDYNSFYVTMDDGTDLAVDLYLPKKLEANKKVPTITYFVRYIRSLELVWPFKALSDPLFGSVSKEEIKYFTSHGYACLIVDSRGTGASFGSRTMEFSQREIEDMNQVVDWIIKQKWSNGLVGSTGISYTATTAELLLVNQHPAVKACIPRNGIWDLYGQMMYPGGMRQAPFIEAWEYTTHSLDNNDFKFLGHLSNWLIKGTHPVKGDKKRKLLKEAIEEHKDNYDVFKGLYEVEYRDQPDSIIGYSADYFSVHNYIDEIKNSGTAIYRISGWYDGSLVNAPFLGYMNNPQNTKVLVGPWEHGEFTNLSPLRVDKKGEDFDIYAEMLRFFDYHLLGINNGIMEEAPISYFQMGSEKFVSTQNWPPQSIDYQNFELGLDNSLSQNQPANTRGMLEYDCQYDLTTGDYARWNSLTLVYQSGPTHYTDRKQQNERMLVFDTEQLTADTEITGHPIVNLNVKGNSTDGGIFVYLEDVSPDGHVQYITEGQLRFKHRKVSENPIYETVGPSQSFLFADQQSVVPNENMELNFELIATSYQVKKGHKIRLAIATSDVEHFDNFENSPSKIWVDCGENFISSIQLPIAKPQNEYGLTE